MATSNTIKLEDTISSSPPQPTDPHAFHSGVWDYAHKRPIANGVYEHPITGALTHSTSEVYSGPPSIDIVIINLFASPNSSGTDVFRCSRPCSMESVLWGVMRVVKEKGLEVHSLNATGYSVVVVLASDVDEVIWRGECGEERRGFLAVAMGMCNELGKD